MRFMTMVKATQDSEKGCMPDERLMAAIGQSADELIRSGKMVGTGGLMPSSLGARVKLSNGQIRVVDGPFAEAKELIGGFAIFEVESKEEAVELARNFVALHRDVLGNGYEMEVEVRQMHDMPPGVG